MLAFWQEALHYVTTEPAKGGWVILRDPQGRAPNLSLDQSPDDDFVVLEDPDGNLFCVVRVTTDG
jgi:hypothetical protein